tara:strand:+ start:1344 stop:2054 length:711 start_codon:yes stop_codon:yes gene_type:complete
MSRDGVAPFNPLAAYDPDSLFADLGLTYQEDDKTWCKVMIDDTNREYVGGRSEVTLAFMGMHTVDAAIQNGDGAWAAAAQPGQAVDSRWMCGAVQLAMQHGMRLGAHTSINTILCYERLKRDKQPTSEEMDARELCDLVYTLLEKRDDKYALLESVRSRFAFSPTPIAREFPDIDLIVPGADSLPMPVSPPHGVLEDEFAAALDAIPAHEVPPALHATILDAIDALDAIPAHEAPP